MQITIKSVDLPLTANGDTPSPGYIQVADTTNLYPGAICNVYTANMSVAMEIQITDLLEDGQSVGCRATNPTTLDGRVAPNYGRTSMAAFTTALGARICQPLQAVRVEPSATKASLI